MIIIKELRELAHKNGLKMSSTAVGEASRVASYAMELACREAKAKKSPKLEREHFAGIISYVDYSYAEKIKAPRERRKRK